MRKKEKLLRASHAQIILAMSNWYSNLILAPLPPGGGN